MVPITLLSRIAATTMVVCLLATAPVSAQGGRVVVSLAALDLHAGPFEVGVLVAMFSAFSVLLALYSGKISDRIGVRTPMLVGTLGMLGALLVPWWVPGMPGLYASASLQGAGFILFNVSVQNLTGALGTLQDRTRNFSLLSLGYSISSLVGPMACGFSIDHAGYSRTDRKSTRLNSSHT